jgi:hypothetical protein
VRREQLEHVLRAASTIAQDPDMLVIGSQSVLGAIPEHRLPEEATASVEVDIAFFDDASEAKADLVDGAIGELSQFHETFGYYAQGVSLSTAVLPEGWRTTLPMFDRGPSPVRARSSRFRRPGSTGGMNVGKMAWVGETRSSVRTRLYLVRILPVCRPP